MLKQLEMAKKGVKHGALEPLENMIRLKELEDDEGKIILKLGNCTNLLTQPFSSKTKQKYKARSIKLW
jgi:hypothetical protein